MSETYVSVFEPRGLPWEQGKPHISLIAKRLATSVFIGQKITFSSLRSLWLMLRIKFPIYQSFKRRKRKSACLYVNQPRYFSKITVWYIPSKEIFVSLSSLCKKVSLLSIFCEQNCLSCLWASFSKKTTVVTVLIQTFPSMRDWVCLWPTHGRKK